LHPGTGVAEQGTMPGTLPAVDWDAHAEREERRYADGVARLPEQPEALQKQLVRVAMAAMGAGLARLMQGRQGEAAGWLARSAEFFRRSFADAPLESWGRPIGAVKARLLAGDVEGARVDARWALEQRPDESGSPIGCYAAVLALLALSEDEAAVPLAQRLRRESPEVFPGAVADALAALAAGDADAYREAAGRVLRSFEDRDAYLEDVPVADTVLVLEALADARGMPARLSSPLLPG
jgi:hypothetical protein